MGAAVGSFIAFAVGAAIPVVPYLFGGGPAAFAVEHRGEPRRAVPRRRGRQPPHRPGPAVQRVPPGRDRRRGRGRDLRRRNADRRRRHGLRGASRGDAGRARGAAARGGLDAGAWSNGPHDRYAAHDHGYDKVLVCASGSIRFGLPDARRGRGPGAGRSPRPAAGTAPRRHRGRRRRDVPRGARPRGDPAGGAPHAGRRLVGVPGLESIERPGGCRGVHALGCRCA